MRYALLLKAGTQGRQAIQTLAFPSGRLVEDKRC